MDRTDQYRAFAAQCIALAAKADDAGDRATLIQMAMGWHELAELLADWEETDRKTLEEELDARDGAQRLH